MATDPTVSSALLLAADDATVSWGRVKKDEERATSWLLVLVHAAATGTPLGFIMSGLTVPPQHLNPFENLSHMATKQCLMVYISGHCNRA